MKKIFLAATITVISLAGFAQSEQMQQMFDKYAGKPGFTTVEVSQKLFDLIASAAPETNADVKEMVGELKGIKILVFEDSTTSGKTKNLYAEAEKTIPLSGYDELMKINSDGDNVRLFTRQSSEKVIDELFMLVGSDNEFVLIDIFGKIDLEKISKLSDAIKVDGLEKLDDINK